MRLSRPRLASKRAALAAEDPQEMCLGSQVKMELKEQVKEEEQEAQILKTRKRARASSPFAPPSPTPAANSTLAPRIPSPRPAPGLPERLGSLPLRCVLTGTNPSATAWRLGHAYAHRSNRFWPLLHSSPGIIPRAVSLLGLESSGDDDDDDDGGRGGSKSESSSGEGEGEKSKASPFSGTATDDELLNEFAGLGLCDVGTGHPETNLSSISSSTFEAWAPFYYARLVEHVRRAARSVGCRCRISEEGGGELEGGGGDEVEGGGGGGSRKSSASSSPSPSPSASSPSPSASSPSSSASSPCRNRRRQHHPSTCCAPRVVAFTGKRQFIELLNAGRGDPRTTKKFDSSSVGYGLQPPSLRPAAWPRCLSETEIWVLTTTSGAAGLTNEARAAPYLELGKRLAREEWPRPLPACVVAYSSPATGGE